MEFPSVLVPTIYVKASQLLFNQQGLFISFGGYTSEIQCPAVTASLTEAWEGDLSQACFLASGSSLVFDSATPIFI